MNGVDRILREKHGNRLSVLSLAHLEPGVVSLTVIPHNGGHLSPFGANFDLSVEQQLDLLESLLANLNAFAPETYAAFLDRMMLPR